MKITRKNLRKIVESYWEPDYTELSGHSVSGMGEEVADAIMNRYPNYRSFDESRLEQLVDNEIGNLQPGPLDDDWPDVTDEAMVILSEG